MCSAMISHSISSSSSLSSSSSSFIQTRISNSSSSFSNHLQETDSKEELTKEEEDVEVGYSHVVYRHPALQCIHQNPNARCFINHTPNPIPANEILLIEHCYSEPFESSGFMAFEKLIAVDKKFFNELWPRKRINSTLIIWNEDFYTFFIKNNISKEMIITPFLSTLQLQNLLKEKLENNIFHIEEKAVLGYESVIFNHAKEGSNNAEFSAITLPCPNLRNETAVFLVFIARKDILQGEEICTSYADNILFDLEGNKTILTKDLNLTANELLFLQERKDLQSFFLLPKAQEEFLRPYISSSFFRRVMKKQAYFKQGVVMDRKSLRSYASPDFVRSLVAKYKIRNAEEYDEAFRNWEQEMESIYLV